MQPWVLERLVHVSLFDHWRLVFGSLEDIGSMGRSSDSGTEAKHGAKVWQGEMHV